MCGEHGVRAAAGLLAGAVAVEGEHKPIGLWWQYRGDPAGLLVGECGSGEGDAGHCAAGGDVDGKRVDWALDEHNEASTLDRGGVLGQPIQMLAFAVDRGLGGVEVLGVQVPPGQIVGGAPAVLGGVAPPDEADDLNGAAVRCGR